MKNLNVDVTPTVEVIREMAVMLQRASEDLTRVANLMEQTGDFERTTDAYTAIRDLNTNLRVDLLIARPVREFEKALYSQKDRSGK